MNSLDQSESANRSSPASGGSVSVSKLKPLIADSEAWAKEYIKREERNRARGAHREAAHFGDLVCAHQNFAGSLRQLVWAAEKRKPTPNEKLCNSPGSGASPKPKTL